MVRLIAINVAVTLGLLVAIEGGVRLFYPEITPLGTDRELFADSLFADAPGPRPGAAGTSNGATFRVDPYGFWAYSAGADTTRRAWLFLGDSVTMGIGVEPDATFAGRVAAHVDSLRILNPSLIGFSSRDYLKVLRTVTDPSYRPFDVRRVTVLWCLNDVYAAAPGLDDPDAGLRRAGGRLLTFVRRHVRTYQWLKAWLFDRPRVYFEHDRRLYAGAPFEAAVDDLRQMQALAEARGFRLDVVLLPYEYQLRAGVSGAVMEPQRRLLAALDTTAIRVHDPSAYLQAHASDPSDLYLFGDGIHFSTYGHARMAEYLLRHLR